MVKGKSSKSLVTEKEADRIRARIEELWLSGCSSTMIAGTLGKSLGYISQMQDQIRKRWRMEVEAGNLDDIRHRLINVHWGTVRDSTVGYQRSQQNAETIRTEYEKVKCEACKEGMLEDGSWCELCGGEGEKIVENQVRTVKGQAGDSSFLMQRSIAAKEIARLHGIDKKNGKSDPPNTVINQAVILNVDGVKVDVGRMSGEDRLQLLALLERNKGNGEALDVDFEKKKEESDDEADR